MKKELGFAMLEVLISFLIIMIGVLGLAGLQMMAINNTEVARYQSLAVLLASNMATQMQSNAAYWGTAPTNITVTNTSITGGPAAGPNCGSTLCTGPEMANYDLQNWGASVASTLPSGNGQITCVANTPAVCTLTLFWLEKNVALSNPTGAETGQLASGQSATHNYQTMVTIQ
ncbi:MAG: type IV pilus modification protein PilV [Sulfuriferula sp.]|nr:type IV pilus modification protein PilV [Sulfuriferula sp.]